MRINAAGVALIKAFEGYSETPYVCPAGIPTIGWGSTRGPGGAPVTLDDPPVAEDEAEALLKRDLGRIERAVARLIRAELTENMFSALVSFAYNLGSGRLQSSTLRMKLNRGDYTGAAAEFPRWRFASGRVLAGLVRRRAAERRLFEG